MSVKDKGVMTMAGRHNILTADIVTDAFRRAGEHAFSGLSQFFYWQTTWMISGAPVRPESAAEAVFLIWFLADQAVEREYQLMPQVTVDAGGQTYRFDFVVHWTGTGPSGRRGFGTPLPVAVEIDGHAFHEKTLDQVTRRNRRDRAVQRAGYTVLHFSYSELMADPLGCVREVTEASGDALAQLVVQWAEEMKCGSASDEGKTMPGGDE